MTMLSLISIWHALVTTLLDNPNVKAIEQGVGITFGIIYSLCNIIFAVRITVVGNINI